MGILSWALRPVLQQRALQQAGQPLTASSVVEWLSGGAGTATGVHVSPDGSLQVNAVWDCVDLVSRDVGRTPVILYRKNGTSRQRAEDDRLYALMHDSPNGRMTAFSWRQTMQMHLMLRGNAFSEIERDRDGRIVALWPLNPDRMKKPTEAQSGTLLYPYQLPSGETVALPQNRVLHLRGLASDGVWGYSPIHVQREAVGMAQAAQEYGARFFANNANPSGVLMTEKRMNEEAVKALRMQWNEMHQGLDKAHRIAILEDGLKWQQMSVSPEDAQFLETRKLSRIEIAAMYHVPPHKIGELDRATFSNIAEQSLDYVGSTLDAEYFNAEQQFNLQLLTEAQRQSLYFEFNRNALVRATIQQRFEAYQKASAWLTGNEMRAFENLNPLEGLDQPLIPVNMALGAENLPDLNAQPQPAANAGPTRKVVRRTSEGLWEITEVPIAG